MPTESSGSGLSDWIFTCTPCEDGLAFMMLTTPDMVVSCRAAFDMRFHVLQTWVRKIREATQA